MNFLIIIIFVSLGWAAKYYHLTKVKHTNLLNRYIIYVCLPAIILLKIPQLNIDQNMIFPVIMAWLLVPVAAISVLVLTRIFGWSKEILGCLLLVVCFGNTSFVGFPIIQAFYGEQALGYAVIYDQVGSFLSLAIIGNLFLVKYSTAPNRYITNSDNYSTTLNKRQPNVPPIATFVIKVFSFPPFIALIIAFLIGDSYIPQIIQNSFWLISLTLVPATMFLVGSYFQLKIPTEFVKPLGWAIVIKMLLTPAFALLLLLSFDQHGLYSQVTFMEAAMPPMVSASILAIHANLAPKLAAAAVGYGLIMAIFVIPLVYWLSNLIK